METLGDSINEAEKQSNLLDGKCTMCAIGDEPISGLHHGRYHCGNNDTCLFCHNAGMEYGDQCMSCGRIEKNDISGGF